MKTNAAAKVEPLPAKVDESVKISFSPVALARAQSSAESELKMLAGATIDNDEDAREANEYLRERTRELDAVEEMLAGVLTPIKEAEKRVRALFSPALARCKEITQNVRIALGSYEKQKREQQRKAFAEAAKVAQLPSSSGEAVTAALVKAVDSAPQKLEGTSFVRTWKVERVVQDLLGPEWLCPDMKKIEAFGKAHKGESAPSIPGVIWVEDFSPRVRR